MLLACVAVCLATLAGCTVGPDYRRPEVDMPAGWAGTSAAATQPSETVAAPADVARWWTAFNDPVLESLVTRAVESNLDLQLATARVRQARASRGIAGAGLWPTVDVAGSYRRTGSGEGDDNDDRFNGETPGETPRRDFDVGGDRSLFQAGLDAAWEIDVFGGTRRDIEAATAELQAAVEDRRDVLVTLAAEVALNYLDLRGFQRQTAIARQNLEAQRRSLAVTRRRQQGGLVGGLDVANAEALVASTESEIPLLESSERQTIYALGVLLGRQPAALLDELTVAAPIPAGPPEVPVGLPSDLLRRRPDVRRAEALAHAATARIGVATADLFPRFSLTGSLGVEGETAGSLGRWENRFWSVGPSVSWPLFDAGRIRANVAVQTAAQEEALLAYRATILVALQDVEVALIAYAKEQQRRVFLRAAVAANRRAVELAELLYAGGETTFLDVLSARRSLLSSEDALARSDRDLAANLVSLYKALGGGWESAP